MSKQNVTLRLKRQTAEKLKALADHRAISISAFITEQIEMFVGKVEKEGTYERARRQAMKLLDRGFHMGGAIRSSRDEWHER